MTRVCDGEIGIPLVVDLDGTLTLTDTLYESAVKFLFRNPAAAVAGVLHLARGPAAVKRHFAEQCRPDPATLPYRADLIEMVKAEKARGRAVHLVTAADQAIADDVARHLDLFETATGSDGRVNLKGPNKLAYLRKTFPGGFIYAGDGRADLPVFTGAQGVVLCDAAGSMAARITQAGVPVVATLRRPANLAQAWLRAFRVHQWAKNLLLFVPLFVGHAFGDPRAMASCAVGFALLCLLSSATYMLNDLADLDADRAHATKRLRPFASGSLQIVHGLIAAPVMIVAALAGALALSPPFAAALAAYFILTTVYSFGLKRVALLDVFAIGLLFTLRIVMGAEIAGLAHSAWLLSFALAFFISLALSKRHGEVMSAGGDTEIAGRGYRRADWPVTLTFGVGIGLVSVVIMLLYMTNDAAPSGFYHHPGLLYAIPALLTLWLMRIWLLSHRMELHDDPVVFALRDGASLSLGLAVAISFYLAL